MANKPNIRFKGFTYAWEQRKLGDIGSIKRGKRFTPADYVESDGIPCIHYGQIYTEYGDVATETISQLRPDLRNQLHYASPGNIVLAGTSESSDTVCKAVAWMGNTQVAYHDDSFAYSSHADSLFLIGFFQSDSFRAQKASIVYGVTVKRVNSDALAKADIELPSIGEQQKIGALFFAIDNLITLHQRKCDVTKELKRYMLQKMFPKNGEKKPEIRFAGFTDDWEQRKVSDLLEERNEQAPESEEYPLMAFIANEGVAPKGERYDRGALVKDAENKNYKKTELGDFIYSSNNLETGSIGLNNYGNASISPVYSIFKPTGIADSDFIGRRFVRKDFINAMVKWRQGVVYGQWKIHESDFLKIEVAVPSLEEQRKIGSYLSELDNLITLHQRKCDNLKELKKYMLQNMFPTKG